MVAQPDGSWTMSVEEWRELERTSHDVKHEYIDGYVYAMAGGSLAHSLLAVNMVGLLNSGFGDGPCIAYNSDASARLSSNRYTYPDATVTCDDRDRPTTEQTEVRYPRVIVEVLSDSTEAYDRGDKFGYYRARSTVQDYVLVATRRQAVEVYRRTPDAWTFHTYGLGDTIELPSIDAHIPLAALYRRTNVPQAPDEPEGEV